MSHEKLGSTHAAHEMRHLARKMQEVRNESKCTEDIQKLIQKIENERKELSEKYEDCCSYLKMKNDLELNIPELSIEEAEKYNYLEGLDPMDFLFISKLETHYSYGTKPPMDEHLHTGMMLLKACINELTWALGELQAYENK